MSELNEQINYNANNINVAKDIIESSRKGENFEKIISDLDHTKIDQNVVVATIEAFATQKQGFLGRGGYLDAFNNARANELFKGMPISREERNKEYKPVSLMTQPEREVFQAEVRVAENLVKTKKNNSEYFNQTSQDTGAGLTQLASIVGTTLLPAMSRYFYDSPIIDLGTKLIEGNSKVEVADIINDRTAEASGETTPLTTDITRDDTMVIDTIDPRLVRISDNKTISWLLNELGDPTTAGSMIGRMERSLRRRVELLAFGSLATPTNGANQFYSILNNLAATGVNRGSIPVVVNGVGIGGNVANANHIDAINYVIQQMPLDGDVSVSSVSICCNFATKMKIMRTLNGFSQYYFEMASGVTRDLATGEKITVISTLPNDLVVVADLSNVVFKFLRAPRFTTRIVDDNYVRLVYDTYGDSTIRFAYKANPAKNGFRHFTLQSNYLT